MRIAISFPTSNRRARQAPRENQLSAIFAVSAVALIGAVALAAAEPPLQPFSVGVLRRDGVVIPFAVFDGKSWSNRWPQPALELTIPTDIRNVPSRWWGSTGPLATWQAWIGKGEPQSLQVVQPDWVPAYCVRQIGLHTDYRPDELPPPPTEQPYPKDGLVIAPPRPIERIDIVPQAGADADALGAELLTAFNRAETQTAKKFAFDHPSKRSIRENIPPVIEAIYAHGTEPRAYYVEAAREYRTMGEHECTVMAFGTGWFVRENGAFRSLAMAVDVLGCDRRGASYMLPLGVVRTGTRLFWLVQFSGWDRERYAVIEPKMKNVDAVLNVWGGGC